MSVIMLIGAIYMLTNGGLLPCLLFMVLVASASTKYTDNNRRGKWWK